MVLPNQITPFVIILNPAEAQISRPILGTSTVVVPSHCREVSTSVMRILVVAVVSAANPTDIRSVLLMLRGR
jgi:hypothetical protein